LGEAPRQLDLLDPVTRFCDESLPASSVYGFLFRERDRLFPDEMFSDLFAAIGRRSLPPSVVATVMVLQRLDGLSDREAVDRFTFDARWRYAAGVGGYDNGGWERFAHTVLVDMRARLDASDDPRRIFKASVDALVRDFRNSSRMPGVDRIYVPGEHSHETRARRARDGIPVAAPLLRALDQLADDLGIAKPR